MAEYRVGVELSLVGNIASALAQISAQMLGLQRMQGQIAAGFAAWRPAILGGVTAFAGYEMFRVFDQAAGAGKKLVHEMAQMKALGLDQLEIQRAYEKSLAVSASVTTTTVSENMKHLRELRYATGHMSDAMKILEPVSKVNAVLNSLAGKTGGQQDHVWALVKSLEMKGLLNVTKPEDRDKFISYIETMQQAMVASGGKVLPEQFQRAFVYGRTARLGWNQEFITEILPRLIQEMTIGAGGGGTGGGPGNPLMSAYAAVIQGKMKVDSAKEFARLGLADVKIGKRDSLAGFSMHGAQMFMENPYEWIQQKLMPAFAKRGITKDLDILTEMSKLFGVRTASDIMAQMALQGRFHMGEEPSLIEKDRRQKRQVRRDAYRIFSDEDPDVIYEQYHKQLRSLHEVVGKPLLELELSLVKGITPMITAMTQFSAVNPGAIRALGVAFAGLAATLTVLGTGALLAGVAAILGGPLTAFIVAIGGIATAVIAAKPLIDRLWEGSKKDVQTVMDMSWAERMKIVMESLGYQANAVVSAFNSLQQAIASVAQSIAAAVGAISKGAGEILKDSPGMKNFGSGVFKKPYSYHRDVDPESYSGGPSGPGIKDIHGWEPSRRAPSTIQVNHTINLDGRVLARSVSKHRANAMEHPTQAPYFDDMKGYTPPDFQITTT